MYSFINISGQDQKLKTLGYGPTWFAGETRIVQADELERLQRMPDLFEQLRIVSALPDNTFVAGSDQVTGGGGGHFVELRPQGYSGAASPGTTLVVLSGSAATVSLQPGINYLLLRIGGACTLTLQAPAGGFAATYEIINADGASSASVIWS